MMMVMKVVKRMKDAINRRLKAEIVLRDGGNEVENVFNGWPASVVRYVG